MSEKIVKEQEKLGTDTWFSDWLMNCALISKNYPRSVDPAKLITLAEDHFAHVEEYCNDRLD